MFKSYRPDFKFITFSYIYMVYIESKVLVADNSGAIRVKILKKGAQKKYKKCLGNLISVSLVDLKSSANLKLKKKVFSAILITLKLWTRRNYGFFIRCGQNRVLLLDDQRKLLANILKGPLAEETKKNNVSSLVVSAVKY